MSSPVQTPAGLLVPGPICQGCVLQQAGSGYMRPTGQPHSGLVLVGEALGSDEAIAGEPFVGAAGHLLNKILRRMKLRRDHVRISNIAWCKPPDNDLTAYQPALNHCLPHLLKDLQALRGTFPRTSMHPAVMREDHEGKIEYPPVSWKPDQPVLVAMGNTAFQALTGWSGIAQFRGYVFWSDVAQAWVVPTYHPAYLLRGNVNQTLWFMWDLEKALRLTRMPHFKHAEYLPLIDPSLDVVADYIGRYKQALKGSISDSQSSQGVALAIDIENPNNVMSRIGFAFGPTGNHTLTLRWAPTYMPAIKELCGSPGRKLGWNLAHDQDNLSAEGVALNGQLEDTMDAWHILHSDLDKSLGEVSTQYLPWVKPWKHRMKEAFEYYNAMDALSLWVNDAGISADLKATGLWGVWQDHIRLRTVTRKMSARGMLVDVTRQAALSNSLGAELSAIQEQMQPLVPDQLKPLDPKNGFVKEPEDTTGLTQRLFKADVLRCAKCGEVKPKKAHFVQKKGTRKTPAAINECAASMPVLQKDRAVTRWVRQLPFTPSTQQLQAYAKHHSHKVYTSWTSGNITMNEESIVKLRGKYPADPLYPLIVKYRDLQKTKSTYVDIELPADGRIRTTMTNKPSSLRFASEEPNMQNWPPFARQLCVAPPGQVLWKRDYSAIEAVLVGYDAMDAAYTRMAKLGIHDFVNAWVLKNRLHLTSEEPSLSWSDADLRSLFKAQKAAFKTQREMCKRIVHLCVPGDHQVLTPSGWVRFDQLLPSDKVAQWSHGGRMTFVKPARHKYAYTGPLHALTGRGISVQMTPNHRVPVYKDQSHGPLHMIEAQDLPKRGAIPINGQLDGTVPWDVWLQLAVAIQADGSLKTTKRGVTWNFVRARKITRLEAALKEAKVHYTKHQYGTRTRFYARQAQLLPALGWFRDLDTKTFNLPDLLQLTAVAKAQFVEEVLYWDGTKDMKGKTTVKRSAYYSMNHANAEAVQTIAHLCGKQSLLRRGKNGLATASLNKRRFAQLDVTKQATVDHSGYVYCVTVPSGCFMVKHNDRISVTGNSNYLGTADRIYMMNKEVFPDRREAYALQAFYFELFPSIPKWHRRVCEQVSQSGYITNAWGYRHYYFSPFHYEPTPDGTFDRQWGEDAKRGVSFGPQSNAAGIMKAAMLAADADATIGDTLLLTIHDELLGACSVAAYAAVQLRAQQIMEAPLPAFPLDPSWGMGAYLSIGTEGSCGYRWSDMVHVDPAVALLDDM